MMVSMAVSSGLQAVDCVCVKVGEERKQPPLLQDVIDYSL